VTDRPQDRLTPEQREHFEERAAIIEFDAGVPREEAERRAILAVLQPSPP
jgi:hypothetical protein